jgi:hypothetical protein
MRVPVFALVVLVALVPSCIADVEDDTGDAAEELRGGGSLANMVPGPCATACLGVAEGACGQDWRTLCESDYPDDEAVACGDVDLTCRAASYASLDTAFGVMACYRDCEHLH